MWSLLQGEAQELPTPTIGSEWKNASVTSLPLVLGSYKKKTYFMGLLQSPHSYSNFGVPSVITSMMTFAPDNGLLLQPQVTEGSKAQSTGVLTQGHAVP